MARPKNKFKRGQKVMLLEEYRSRPKMSASILIPPGKPLTVLKTCAPNQLSPETWIIVKGFKKGGFDYPIPEDRLVPYSPIGQHLYDGVVQDSETDHGVILLGPNQGSISSNGVWTLGPPNASNECVIPPAVSHKING